MALFENNLVRDKHVPKSLFLYKQNLIFLHPVQFNRKTDKIRNSNLNHTHFAFETLKSVSVDWYVYLKVLKIAALAHSG